MSSIGKPEWGRFAALGTGLSYFRQVGTSPVERWYSSSTNSAVTYATVAPTLDYIFTAPFVSSRGGTLDRIGIQVTAGGTAGSKMRVGLYNSVSDKNLTPYQLIVDSGELDTTTTGMKTATISVVLVPDSLYHLVWFTGTAAPTIRGIPAANAAPLGGSDNVLGTDPGTAWYSSLAFQALPATMTVHGVTTGGPAFVGVRYSA